MGNKNIQLALFKPDHEKTCLIPYGNNKDADQSVHLRNLMSAFVVHSLDSTIPIFAVSKISRLEIASIAEQAGLNLTWLQNPEDTFSHDVVHLYSLQ